MKEYAEGYDPIAEEEKKPEVDESVQLIRDVSATKEFVSICSFNCQFDYLVS